MNLETKNKLPQAGIWEKEEENNFSPPFPLSLLSNSRSCDIMSFQTPVDVSSIGTLVPLNNMSLGNASFLLLFLAFFLGGLFFVQEGSKVRGPVVVSVILAALSSLSVGFGLVVTLMWAGIFV
jgi:hypothetical protein